MTRSSSSLRFAAKPNVHAAEFLVRCVPDQLLDRTGIGRLPQNREQGSYFAPIRKLTPKPGRQKPLLRRTARNARGLCSGRPVAFSSACSSMPNPRPFEIGKVHQAGALKTIECRRIFSGWNSYNATRSGGKAVALGNPPQTRCDKT